MNFNASLVVLGAALFSQNAFTQAPSEADMQRMMQRADAMQRCFSQVDQSALEKLANDAKAIEKELKALCKEGKRDEAMDKAVAFARQVSNSKDLKTIRRCGDMAQQFMPRTIFEDYAQEKSQEHVCDVI